MNNHCIIWKLLAMKHIEPHCHDIADTESMPEEPGGHHEVILKFFSFPFEQVSVQLYSTYVEVYND